MSLFTNKVSDRCNQELARWNDGEGRETVDPFRRYVGEYWKNGLKISNIDGATVFEDSKGRKFRPAWSAAFVSYIFRECGAGAAFYYSEAHIHYTVKALRDAAAGKAAAFLGRDPTTYAPKVGDIVTAGRGASSSVNYQNVLKRYGSKPIPDGNFMTTHSDIVVSVDLPNRTLRTIGGNVATDTVGAKQWSLNANGTLADGASLICAIECKL